MSDFTVLFGMSNSSCMPLLLKISSRQSIVSVTYIFFEMTKSFLMSWFCIGVNPVNSSNAMTEFLRMADSSATLLSTLSISSAVIYLSCINFSNAS